MKQTLTTMTPISPTLALGMTTDAVLRSVLLQAVTHHYGAFTVQNAGINDLLLDAALKRISSAPDLTLGTDPKVALDIIAGTAESTEETGVHVSDLRNEALRLLIAAAGTRATPASDEFVTASPFGRIVERRGSTLRAPASDEDPSELPDSAVFVDFDAEGFPGFADKRGAVLIRTTLATVKPDRLCGTTSEAIEQVALIHASGASAGTIAAEDFDVVLEGLLEDAYDALNEAYLTAFGQNLDAEDAARHLRDLYTAAPKTARAAS